MTQAFEELKKVKTSVSVLALSNFSQSFMVKTDVSGYGLGVVRMQDHRPLPISARYRQRGSGSSHHMRGS